MKRIYFIFSILLPLATIAAPAGMGPESTVVARVESEKAVFKVVQMAGGLDHPWSLAFLPDGRILLTERSGSMRILDGGRLQTVSGVPAVWARGQGGLLDVVLHPHFTENSLVYFSFAMPDGRGGAGTAVARARLRGNALEDVRVIWALQKTTSGTIQFGSRLLFGPDGKLYVTVGDRGEMNRAQDPLDGAGKILRLNDDGTIPSDNPFVGRAGILPEIYALGVRNPQGLALRPGTDQIWAHQHGPRGGDGLDLLKAGANYGWPVITYGINYDGTIITKLTHKEGMEQPVVYWVPSIAPSGLAFYEGDAFPGWRGSVLLGALAGQQLRRLSVSGDGVSSQEVLLKNSVGRVRDVKVGPDGLVYLLTDEFPGRLLRLEPVSP